MKRAEIVQRLAELKIEKKELKKELEGLPEYENGWYKHPNNKFLGWLMYLDVDSDLSYGFTSCGEWISESPNRNYIQKYGLIKATDKEVFERLEAEAVKLKGEKVINLYNDKSELITSDMRFRCFNDSGEISVWAQESGRGVCIFDNGKWAKILPQPKPNYVTLNGDYTINCLELMIEKLEK